MRIQTDFDVLIAGGGVMGSACAYFLHADPDFSGSIAVVEPDPSYREAASSRSASSIRLQFSTPVNIALSRFGMEFVRAGDFGLVDSTYLFLASAQGRPALERSVATQQAAAVPVSLHDGRALSRRYPWLNTADLAAGSDTAGGEGWFDGHALLTALRGANERGGVRYLRDRVVALERSQGRVAAAHLQEHGRINCRHAVIAAGTRSRALAASAGIELPVYARKRNVFVFTCPVEVPGCPLVIDPSGLWFRAEGDRFLCGVPESPDPDVSPDDFEVNLALFEDQAWPILAHRVPAFESIRLSSAWAGHYDYNVFDQNAFVGPVPGISNLLLASGFSGHGLQQAPGVGRALAEYIRFGRFHSIDLAALSYARFLTNEPMRETNVI
jgi:glycine/D-amino acid oxidase-like deaminating enzyme